MDRKLEEVKKMAKKLKMKNWETLEISEAKNKRFSIISPKGKKINFGLWPFKGDGAFIDHKDNKIRDAWQSRHSKIMKDGKPAYKNPESAEHYSWFLLW